MTSSVSKFFLSLAAVACMVISAQAANTPAPDIIPNFQKACDNFATTCIALKDRLPNVKSAADLAAIIRQWADANAQFIKAATALTKAYPTPPPEFKPAIDKMKATLQEKAPNFPTQLTELTKTYQEDPTVKEAMKYFEEQHQAAQK